MQDFGSEYRVIDDFELSNLGGKFSYLQPKIAKESFAGQIHYYTSLRVDGANYVTDCAVESVLDEQQVYDVNYSDSIVRFAVKRHLTSLGIHGTFMNYYKNGEPKYRRPKIVHRNRTVIRQEKNKYIDSESVKFLDLSLKEILDASSP